MNIYIDENEVKKTGDSIIGYASDFSDEIKEFDNIITSIDDAWSGADELKYVNLLREKYEVQLNELSDLIQTYGMYLSKIPNVYSSLDEAYSSKNISV